jgi:serine/threonine protein phosphatase 1
MRRFVIGDIHGRHEALKEVLKKADFDYEEDLLIVLGDIVDGGYRTKEVVDELLKITHLVFIIGNHDVWWMNHMRNGWAEEIWLQQGGANTLRSYGAKVQLAQFMVGCSYVSKRDMHIPEGHKEFFDNGVYYYKLDNMIFVHGGFNPAIPIEKNTQHNFTWDRDLINTAKKKPIKGYAKVFVGHTTTQLIKKGTTTPIKYNNLWAIDTGAGWNGKLTIMDIDTERYWQSQEQKPGGRQ